MNTKLLVACCALVMAASPLANGHLTSLTNGSAVSGAVSDGDVCRYEGALPSGGCTGNSGVSGNYVGPAGIGVESDLFPLTVGPFDFFPDGYIATANMLCDMEVLGFGDDSNQSDNPLNDLQGNDPTDVLNEDTVDDDDEGGVVPDGGVDDGGQGGACHTDHYAYTQGPLANYNTPGCGGVAAAEDLVSQYLVNILASCDDTSQVAGPGLLTVCLNIVTSGGNPTQVAECEAQAMCLVPNACGAVGDVEACGADGSADQAFFGEGGGDMDESDDTVVNTLFNDEYDTPTGVAYPTAFNDPGTVGDCNLKATKAVFVLVGVDVSEEDTEATVIPATVGWIDEGADGEDTTDDTGGSEPVPIGDCFNGEDDDDDTFVDFPEDTGCDSPLDASET